MEDMSHCTEEFVTLFPASGFIMTIYLDKW